MELTILGSCGPYPTADGVVSSYLISSSNANVVLDFGAGAAARVQRVLGSLDKIDAVILSHLHFDHISDLFAIIYYPWQKPLKVYCPFTASPMLDLLKSFPVFELMRIDESSKHKIGDLEFTFSQMPHPIESYATKITNGKKYFVYSGDTVLDKKLIDFCHGTDLLLLDCGRTPLNPNAPHLNLDEAEIVAKETGAKIIATHLYPKYEYKQKSPQVEIAKELETYNI